MDTHLYDPTLAEEIRRNRQNFERITQATRLRPRRTLGARLLCYALLGGATAYVGTCLLDSDLCKRRPYPIRTIIDLDWAE